MGNLVVKSNALIEASYSLDVVEQRVILLAILEARERNVEIGLGTKIKVYAKNYANTYGISKDMAYKAMKKAVVGLHQAEFRWIEMTPKGIKHTHSRFTDTISYCEGDGCIELIFGSQVISQIIDLKRLFTSYEIEQTRNLNRYGLRLYELLIRWRATGYTKIDLNNLRNALGILDHEYQAMGDFKKRVLDLAVNEINENTDLLVEYEQHKQGRKIIGFTFKFTAKTKPKTVKTTKTTAQLQEPKRDPKTVDLFDGLTDLERQAIQNKIDEHIIRLERNGDIVGDFHRQNITKKAINERWGVDVALKKQALEQAEQERLAKEQAKKLADEQAKQEQAKKAEQRRNAMIAKFESLSFDEQEQILDEVGTFYKDNVFEKWFVMAREQRTAHKDVMFMSYFFKVLEC